MKTDNDIKTALYTAITALPLANEITGDVCKRSRTFGSSREDIVISVLASDGCGQIQRVYVNVNIYVSDLYNSANKAWEIDDLRVGHLSELSEPLFSLFNDWFHVRPERSSRQVLPTGASFEDGHTEHLINNKLFIEISNE